MSRRTMRRGMLRGLLAGAAAAALALTGAVSAAAEEPPTATITGTVTREADGTPVDNVGVFVSSTAGGFSFNGYTDVNGDYAVTGLPAGEYVVHFSPLPGYGLADEYWDNAAQWFSADRIQTAGGETIADIDAALAAPPVPGSITGTVTREADGSPVVGATVSASMTGGGWGWGSTTTGVDGSYTLPALEPGAYVLTFRADGTDLVTEYWDDAVDWTAATPVALTSGGAATGINAELAVGGTVSGTVTRTDGGSPAEGVQVEVQAENGGIVGQTHVGADGTYQIGGLATGAYTVHFQSFSDPSLAAEYWEDARTLAAATRVDVTAGQAVSAIDASLETAGHLSGTMTKAVDGVTLGGYVNVTEAATGDHVASAWVQQDGIFDIAVAPGTYNVKFSTWESGILEEYWDNAYTLSDAESVTVNSGQVVSGMNVQLDAAAVISGVVTMISDEDREVIVEAYDGKTLVGSAHASLEDGTYRLLVPAGTYTLKASAIFYNDSATTAKPQWSDGVKQQKKATPVTVATDAPVGGVDFTLVAKTE